MKTFDVNALRNTATTAKERLDAEAAAKRADEAEKRRIEEERVTNNLISNALHKLDQRIQEAAEKGEFKIDVFSCPTGYRDASQRAAWEYLEKKIAEMGLKVSRSIRRVGYDWDSEEEYTFLEARWD